MKKIFPLMMLLLLGVSTLAQDSTDRKKSPFEPGVGLVSRFVWRGTCLSKSPNIQPYFEYAPKFGLKAGAWGSYDFAGDYAEVDLYVGYGISGFTLTATDYFVMDESADNNHFFDYKNETTGHTLEASLGYEGPEKFPIRVLAATMLYGCDKLIDVMTVDTVLNDTTCTYKNAYSTYFEVGYTIKNVSLFVGVTPAQGLYGNKAGLVNAGISVEKEIKITEHFSLPVQAALITNPQKQNIFLVVGVAF